MQYWQWGIKGLNLSFWGEERAKVGLHSTHLQALETLGLETAPERIKDWGFEHRKMGWF